MIRRLISLLFLAWAIGFLWFVAALPRPAEDSIKTDAVIVPTGGAGRIARGLEVLDKGLAEKMLVSGVDPEVLQDIEPAAHWPRTITKETVAAAAGGREHAAGNDENVPPLIGSEIGGDQGATAFRRFNDDNAP